MLGLLLASPGALIAARLVGTAVGAVARRMPVRRAVFNLGLHYLETVVAAGEWDKTPPGPALPDEVVERSIGRYLEAYERLTGSTLDL